MQNYMTFNLNSWFSFLLIVTCDKFHTQNQMIYLAPGDNHIALEIEK